MPPPPPRAVTCVRRYPVPAVLAASLSLFGCSAPTAVATPTTVAATVATPAPPAGTKYHNYCVGKFDPMPSNPGKWRSGIYVADIPGFPLPLFSDPDKKDVTTAHLTGCTDGSFGDDGAMSFSFTFYYDETPDGDFSDLDTLCGDEDGVRNLGGDITVAPFVGGNDDIARGADVVPTRTVVDRSAAVVGPDGRTMTFPSPEGTEWRILTRYDEPTDLIEIWVYDVVTE